MKCNEVSPAQERLEVNHFNAGAGQKISGHFHQIISQDPHAKRDSPPNHCLTTVTHADNPQSPLAQRDQLRFAPEAIADVRIHSIELTSKQQNVTQYRIGHRLAERVGGVAYWDITFRR